MILRFIALSIAGVGVTVAGTLFASSSTVAELPDTISCSPGADCQFVSPPGGKLSVEYCHNLTHSTPKLTFTGAMIEGDVLVAAYYRAEGTNAICQLAAAPSEHVNPDVNRGLTGWTDGTQSHGTFGVCGHQPEFESPVNVDACPLFVAS